MQPPTTRIEWVKFGIDQGVRVKATPPGHQSLQGSDQSQGSLELKPVVDEREPLLSSLSVLQVYRTMINSFMQTFLVTTDNDQPCHVT
ncbi:hypothetical protein EMPG_11184 [Blastomyces silverae]|uniref:Uncharacterized protein n=1 Tax=Blastomyces silverae TaxID=2060906 RepID=A0A0H1B2Y7_9EURO|nr:hypothetical protein EMPG_11184 [Blastomyces silverae]